MLSETEEKVLREHVKTLSDSVKTRAYLFEQLAELRERPEDRTSSESHLRREELSRVHLELSDHNAWLTQVSLIRREILLHLHLDKLEGLGLEYPEVPAYLRSP